MEARLGGNTPRAALSNLVVELNAAIAHMEMSLIERPEWAKDFLALEDPNVILALFAEVDAHEGHYFRRKPHLHSGETTTSGDSAP